MLKLRTVVTVERVTLLINSVACLASLFSDVLNIINNKNVNKDSFKIRANMCGF